MKSIQIFQISKYPPQFELFKLFIHINKLVIGVISLKALPSVNFQYQSMEWLKLSWCKQMSVQAQYYYNIEMLRKFISSLTLLGLFLLVYSQSQIPSYDQYLQIYNKVYTDNDKVAKEKLYNSIISGFPDLSTKYNITVGINNFTDWSNPQILKLKGYVPKQKVNVTVPYTNYPNIPKQLDWRIKNKITSVKYQGFCASSWAFSATAYAESKLIIDGIENIELDLSEQRVFQCTNSSGCGGGILQNSIKSIVKGVLSQSSYPYDPTKQNTGICDMESQQVGKTIQTFYDITNQNLMQLLQERPVIAAVSTRGWTFYQSGVFSCDPTDPADHSILVVGYTQDYWIAKNSWGQQWGEKGFIRISKNLKNNCRINSVVIRTFDKYLHLLTGFLLVIFIFNN